jgi:D-3-phosphoglycerate dehydrogenase / 2-oxoglutarate reductase
MVSGYDPGLSVQSALKLPKDLQLVDSITSACAGADYISINIPYIKGEGGTHGIIGPEVISHFKKNAVLLNFARGELVDSEAMKAFLDAGDGRYVSDFPDDVLWDHKNAIIIPHLGASTEEAEDAAVSSSTTTFAYYTLPDTHITSLFSCRHPWLQTPFAISSKLEPLEIV